VARLKRGRKTWIVAKTFVAAALIVLLVANLSLGDRRIEVRGGTEHPLPDPGVARGAEPGHPAPPRSAARSGGRGASAPPARAAWPA